MPTILVCSWACGAGTPPLAQRRAPRAPHPLCARAPPRRQGAGSKQNKFVQSDMWKKKKKWWQLPLHRPPPSPHTPPVHTVGDEWVLAALRRHTCTTRGGGAAATQLGGGGHSSNTPACRVTPPAGTHPPGERPAPHGPSSGSGGGTRPWRCRERPPSHSHAPPAPPHPPSTPHQGCKVFRIYPEAVYYFIFVIR